MPYGICILSCVPARKEASHSSEMVTQLLFGDHYTILESKENWLKIKIAFDAYECWINARQHLEISSTEFQLLDKQVSIYCKELIHTIHNQNNQLSFPITAGASLPFYINGHLKFDEQIFDYDGQISYSDQKQSVKDLLSTAFLFLNTPYLWGGKTPLGIDCSGFTQLVYKLNGYKLPRDAYQQVEHGSPLSFVDEAEAGDLAFFDNEDGRIVHVGILINKQEIIHASGSVRIDQFDHYGIYNKQTKKYSHQLRVIKHLL